MKKFLLWSAAVVLAGASTQAFAQDSYSAKSTDGRILQESRYINNQNNQQPIRQSRAERSSDITAIEPAAGEEMSESDFSGPYIGADAGYAIGSYGVADPAGPDGDVGLDGFEGGIFAGWGITGNTRSELSGYGAIELGYEWAGMDGDLGGTSYEKDHSWLVTVKPGVVVDGDALGYGILGYSRAEFEGGGSDEDFDGLVLGLGTEVDTNMPARLRLEYAYTNYTDENLGAVDFDGHENAIKAGLLFRFN